MSGFSDYWAKKVLDHTTGKTDVGSLPTAYVALFTVAGIDAGTGFTEVSGNAYARVATAGSDWGAATASAPSTATNANAITFPAASGGNWGTVVAFGLYDAMTMGNLIAWDYLGNYAWMPVFVTSASPGVIDAKAHGFSVANTIVFSTEYGGTAPTFSQSNFTGLLVIANAATDTLDVTNSATQVNTSSTGSGMIRKVASQAINDGITALFPASSLVVSLA